MNRGERNAQAPTQGMLQFTVATPSQAVLACPEQDGLSRVRDMQGLDGQHGTGETTAGVHLRHCRMTDIKIPFFSLL